MIPGVSPANDLKSMFTSHSSITPAYRGLKSILSVLLARLRLQPILSVYSMGKSHPTLGCGVNTVGFWIRVLSGQRLSQPEFGLYGRIKYSIYLRGTIS